MKKLDHINDIVQSYDTYVIDLWGVMHNGIILNESAINVVENLSTLGKKIVFLSNAPRPSEKVKNFLIKMRMEERFLKHIVTSGEAAMHAINQNKYGKFFYHLGPSRDESIFTKVKNNKSSLEKSDFILCTGLLDSYGENLDQYKILLKDSVKKKLICTNPDLIVHRGTIKEFCAGKIAEIFESLGGQVVYFGKPHKEIYKLCFEKKEKVLAIGDNLRTDIKGANNLNKDCLFISNGVHRGEFKDDNELQTLLKKYAVKANYYQEELKW